MAESGLLSNIIDFGLCVVLEAGSQNEGEECRVEACGAPDKCETQ